MHEGSLVVAHPPDSEQLLLLFHGVGLSAQELAPLGQAIAQALPVATVISVEAPYPSELGRGKEWFSVIGVTEDNRPGRIAKAMPLFLEAIAYWQGLSGIRPERTVLLGFSQGAIMSLESTQARLKPEQAAHTVIALAGRFAEPVRRVAPDVRVHLIHGDSDGIVMPQWSIEADSQLRALSGQVTLEIVPGLGHGIDARALRHVLNRLRQK